MSVNLSPIGNGFQFLDSNGKPLNGGFLNTYAAGSSAPQPTFTTSVGNIQNTNPIVLNADGRPPNEIWQTSGVAYKFVLMDSLGNLIATYDNLSGINDVSNIASANEWINGNFTGISYLSGTSFSVTGDQTSVLTVNRRVKTTNTGGVIYGYISASSFAAGITTVTIVNDSSSLDSGLSAVYYGIINSANSSLFPSHVTQVVTFDAVPLGTILPAGVMMPYGGSSAPSGWLLCDGSSYLRITYSALFTAIGTAYGSADGTHFNVPDMRGRSLIGAGTGTTTETVTASSSNGFTVSANNTKWITGMPVVLSNLSGFTTTATAGPTYYISRISSTNVRLSTTLALAQAGTPDITISGTGTCILTYTLTARTLGEVGGEEGHAESSTEQLAHTHAAHILSGSGGTLDYSTTGGSTQIQTNTASTGGNAAMNIMHPFSTVNYIIKT